MATPTREESDPPDWFWELLGSAGRNLRSLCHLLEELPEARLREYHAHFEYAKELVNPYSEWTASRPHLAECPSEDGADDFAAWVVMEGREFHQEVRGHPEDVRRQLALYTEVESRRRPDLVWDKSVDRAEYRGYQRADYIVIPIYRARFGEEL